MLHAIRYALHCGMQIQADNWAMAFNRFQVSMHLGLLVNHSSMQDGRSKALPNAVLHLRSLHGSESQTKWSPIPVSLEIDSN